MAHVYDIYPFTLTDPAIYLAARWLRFLRDMAGWTIPLSGVNGSGPTGDNLGSGDLTVSTDWVCMQSPDAARQFLFQRASNTFYGTLYYSPGALFTGGSATVRATATDEVIINGSSYMFIQGSTAGGVITYFADTSAPYGFYMLGWQLDWGAMYTKVVFDPLNDTDPSDNDPYIWHIGSSNPIQNFTYTNICSETTSTGGVSRCVGTLGNGTFGGTIPGLIYRDSGDITIPTKGLSNRFTRQMATFPIPYLRRSDIVNPGYKGTGTLVRWNGWETADFGTTLGSRTRICFGAVNVPWNGSIPLSGSYG